MSVAGYVNDSVISGMRSVLGHIIDEREKKQDWTESLVIPDKTKKTWERYGGFYRVPVFQRWYRGKSIPKGGLKIFTQDIQVKRFGLGVEINEEDEAQLSNPMSEAAGRTIKQKCADISTRLYSFLNKARADMLGSVTTLLKDGASFLCYDGDTVIRTTSGSLGLATGNQYTYNIADPANMTLDEARAGLGIAKELFRTMTDEFGYTWHDQTVLDNDANFMIITAPGNEWLWKQVLAATFYPAYGSGSTSNAPINVPISELVAARVNVSPYLAANDFYIVLLGQPDKKPFVELWYDGWSPENAVSVSEGKFSSEENGGVLQFRMTDPNDRYVIDTGEALMGAFYRVGYGGGDPHSILKFHLT